MNLRQEFEEAVGDRVVKCAIVQIEKSLEAKSNGNYRTEAEATIKLQIGYNPEEYQNFLEFLGLFNVNNGEDYDRRLDKIEGTIWFVDGSWADRESEYALNGSWWEVRELPAIPMELGEEPDELEVTEQQVKINCDTQPFKEAIAAFEKSVSEAIDQTTKAFAKPPIAMNLHGKHPGFTIDRPELFIPLEEKAKVICYRGNKAIDLGEIVIGRTDYSQEAKRFDLRLSSKILVQGLTVLKLYENPVQAIEEGTQLEKTHRGGLDHTPKFYRVYESIPFSKYGQDVATSIALRGEEISIEYLQELAAEWSEPGPEPGPEPEISEEPETFI